MRSLGKLNASLWSTNKFLTNKRIIIWLLVALSLSASLTLADSPGDLDPTFGSGGIVTTTLGGEFDEFKAVAVQSDGKIVAVGSANIGYASYFLVVRYNSDGSLDNTFANGGVATLDYDGTDQAKAVAIQSDGKIVVVGQTDDSSSLSPLVALIRYNSDGSLDTSLNGDGIVTTDTVNFASINALAIQNDGKFLIAGADFSNFLVFRYDTDGALDTTFDGDGIITTSFGSTTSAQANAIAVQSDGKIIAVGEANDDFALARYNSDGSLDTTFDSDGLVTTQIWNDVANDITIQSDGKIVVVGTTSDGMAVVRYNSDGSLDNTFNGDGTLTVGDSSDDKAHAVALQSSNKIVVGGTTVSASGDTMLTLLRVNGDGSLDTTFGTGGVSTFDITNSDDDVSDIAIQADDKIVAVGQSGGDANTSYSNRDSMVARFNSSGALDNTFGTTGVITTAIGIAGHDGSNAVMQADGKILVTGDFGTNHDFVVVRYNSDGTLDSSFDGDGVVTTNLTDNGYSNVIAVQNNGKVVVAGAVNRNFAVARYNTNGSLDTSFGTGGIVTTDLGNDDYIEAIALQGDGKIIVAGESDNNGVNQVAVARYNSNGSLDTTFGSSGIIITDLGDNEYEYATAIALQSDGKIIVGVYSDDFTLIRYNPDGSFDTSFDGDGIAVITGLSGVGSVYAVSLQNDGKIIGAGYFSSGYMLGDFAVVRYNSDGSVDTSFGTGGVVTTDLGGNLDTVSSVAVQGDGRIVAAGGKLSLFTSRDSSDFGLVRYNSDGSLDTGFGINGTIITEIGDSSYISTMLLQNDGRIVAAGDSRLGFTVARYLNDSGNITSVSPTTGGTLQQPSTGLSGTVGLTLTVPAGAVTQDTTLVFNNQSASGNPTIGFSLGGIVFTLEAFVNNVEQPNFTFNTPATLTFAYSDADVAGLPGGEASLDLRYWDGSTWSTDGITKVSHDVDTNTITFQITHLTEFALLGPASSSINTYIPVIVK